jgi:hypothetical protein
MPHRQAPRHIRTFAACSLLALVLLGLAGCESSPPPLELPVEAELELVEDASGRPLAIDATGLGDALLDRLRHQPLDAEEWAATLRVSTEGGAPVPGDYRVTSDAVRFIPAQPFARGEAYRARWRDAEAIRFEPARDGAQATTRVAAIYPSADLLPQNLARLHILFSAPMIEGRAGQHVRLTPDDGNGEPLDAFAAHTLGDVEQAAGDADGSEEEAVSEHRQSAPAEGVEPAPDPPLAEEWNQERTRLTLRLAGDAEGRTALESGRRYRLLVDRGWEDARGVPLRDSFEKVFGIVEPDRQPPAPESWSVSPPLSPAAPLLVDFDAPLDHVSLSAALEVLSQDRRIAGRVLISNDETRWAFSPEQPWKNGRYVVRLVAELLDPAGNSIGAASGAGAATGIVLPFRIELEEPPAPRGRRGG